MFLEKEEMKFAVLFAIKQFKAPISESLVYEIFTWDKDIMDYFDLSGALSELLEDGYVCKKFYRNEEALSLTEKGEAACGYFKERVPFSIRERIVEAIGRIKYDELVDPNIVLTDVVFVTDEQYMAKCSIMEDKVPMLELGINMGKRHQAERVAEYFKKNSKKIYDEILKLCTEDSE